MSYLTNYWWQILVATVTYWILGAIWFNPKVFGTLWQKGHGLPEMTDERRKEAMKMFPLMMLKSYVAALFICIALCYMMISTSTATCSGPAECMPAMIHNLKLALLVSIFAIGGGMSMGYVYLMKPTMVYLVDIGYHVVGCIIAITVLHLLCCHL